MIAEPGPLLELHVAVIDPASVRIEVRVGIHMLGHILSLCKPTIAHLAFVLFIVLMCYNKMPLQAKPRRKHLFTSWHGAYKVGHSPDIQAISPYMC